MSRSLEQLLDIALNTRQQRRRQRVKDQADRQSMIVEARAELEHQQRKFRRKICSLMDEVVERANRHLATRSDHCEFRDISGCYTGPLHVGNFSCNPIAYKLETDDEDVGGVLLIELTNDGFVEASLGPLPSTHAQWPMVRTELGWHSVPLDSFDASAASDLLAHYVHKSTGL